MYLITEQMQQWYRQYVRNHNGQLPVNFNIRDEKKGNAALHLALETVTKRPDVSEMIHQLLAGGADPNLANDAGETSLHVLCKRDNVECQDDDELVKFFLVQCDHFGKRVQLDVRDGRGHTALEYAAANLLPNAVEVLLRRGADLAGFRFPSVAQFNEFIRQHYRDFEVRAACGILAVVERLEQAEYRMMRSDATTIMKIFIGNDLYMRSDDPDRYFYLQERFARKAAGIDLSIPDRVQEMERQRLLERARRTRPQGPTMSYAAPPAVMNLIQIQVDAAGRLLDREGGRRQQDNGIHRTKPRGVGGEDEEETGGDRETETGLSGEEKRTASRWSCPSTCIAAAARERGRGEIERGGALPRSSRSSARQVFAIPTDRVRTRLRSPAAVRASAARGRAPRGGDVPRPVPGETREDRGAAGLRGQLRVLGSAQSLYRIPVQFPRVCGVHLCEKLARGFFRRWALEPFERLQAGRWRLSRTRCEPILEHLSNEDLWRICLAAEVEAALYAIAPLAANIVSQRILMPLVVDARPRLRWRGVATWRWVANDDNCGICRMPFDAACPDCKIPGDDCPLVWGQCSHCFHIHCIMKWLNSQQTSLLCPMCRQEWKFKE
ncbi:unnamed protein product [Trichogramma brassicae]|uniref:Anaphase-promoting complex subunit 11 n=1 Tax=Trichogramma brassicae TaxID=86971 RepID=A0A6H5I0A9_9HYME|nr:unnamed protein product [Trichogramma brassicae]